MLPMGEGQKQRYQENAQADRQIVDTHGVAQQRPDLVDYGIGAFRQQEKQ